VVANYSFSSRLLKWREKRYVLFGVPNKTICAEFGGVSSNFTATTAKLIKAFLVTFFSKKVTLFT
jgi:hypothetical protein